MSASDGVHGQARGIDPFVFDIYKLFYYVYFSSLWLFTILGPVSNPYRKLNKNTKL